MLATRRSVVLFALLGVVLVAVIGGVAAAPAVQNRLTYGTFSTQGPPPRVDYCGRRYYPSEPASAQTRSEIDDFLRKNGFHGLQQIATAPSGMPILANVIPAEARVAYQTRVCTMILWVKITPDRYVGYSLSGGP
jgi:hypothetical protein